MIRTHRPLVTIALTSAAFLSRSGAEQGKAETGKELRFEVVSIKAMPPDGGIYSGPTGNTKPSPNGFDSRLSLWQLINVAYGPVDSVNWGSVEIRNAPNWIGQFYDIKGRVSQADLKAWQNQGTEH